MESNQTNPFANGPSSDGPTSRNPGASGKRPESDPLGGPPDGLHDGATDAAADLPWKDRVRLGESWREWLKVGGPVLLLSALAFFITWHFVEPAPPRRVVIAAGSKAGAYYKFALEYAKYFGKNGIFLEVRETKGSVENYRLLDDPHSGVDLAIVQSGTAPESQERRDGLEAVCGVYFEPVWVFYREEAFRDAGGKLAPPTRLTQLAGKRLAIGKPGSGVQPLARTLLRDNGLLPPERAEATAEAPPPATAPATAPSPAGSAAAPIEPSAAPPAAPPGVQLKEIDSDQAVRELSRADGEVDAAFFVISPDAAVIRTLGQMPGVRLMSFEHARAYSRRHQYLWPVTLYEGALDLAHNRPERDVQLVAPSATLVSRASTHKGIVGLLVQAALQIHGGGTLLSDPGVFPSAEKTELPVGKDAKYFLTTKPGWLHRTLPFWLASLIDRLLILVVPSLVVLLPLVRLAPPIYRWRMRSRVYRWYRELRRIDRRLTQRPTPAEVEADLRALSRLEKEVLSVKVPLSYMEEFYNLRLHLGYVRLRLESSVSGAVGRAALAAASGLPAAAI